MDRWADSDKEYWAQEVLHQAWKAGIALPAGLPGPPKALIPFNSIPIEHGDDCDESESEATFGFCRRDPFEYLNSGGDIAALISALNSWDISNAKVDATAAAAAAARIAGVGSNKKKRLSGPDTGAPTSPLAGAGSAAADASATTNAHSSPPESGAAEEAASAAADARATTVRLYLALWRRVCWGRCLTPLAHLKVTTKQAKMTFELGDNRYEGTRWEETRRGQQL